MVDLNIVKQLAALAHPARLQVFRALVVAGPAGLTPGAMLDGVGIAGTTLSFHLKELTHAGLVHAERAGRHLVYRAAYDRMEQLIGYLTHNCCQGGVCDVPASTAACDR